MTGIPEKMRKDFRAMKVRIHHQSNNLGTLTGVKLSQLGELFILETVQMGSHRTISLVPCVSGSDHAHQCGSRATHPESQKTAAQHQHQ